MAERIPFPANAVGSNQRFASREDLLGNLCAPASDQACGCGLGITFCEVSIAQVGATSERINIDPWENLSMSFDNPTGDYPIIIPILAPGEPVRKYPHMYFGTTREDPQLPAAVMRAVLADTLDDPSAPALAVEVLVDSDWRFRVTDNSPHHRRSTDGTLLPGWYDDTLLDLRRNGPALAAALCVHTLVEVWAGVSYKQELAGADPITPILDDGPTSRVGTRVTFDLDRDYFGPAAVFPDDLSELRTGRVAQTLADRGGTLVITDLRHGEADPLSGH